MNSKSIAIALALTLLQSLNTAFAQLYPANPNAIYQAGQVLRLLDDLPNRTNDRLIISQDLGHGNSIASNYERYVGGLHQQTGKWIGMIGGDYGLDPNHNVAQSTNVFIDHWYSGGLVTISWHLDNPWTGGDSWDTNNQENLWELITPGSAVYNRWQMQLAEIADALRPLRDAGVVVLWRPFHEVNGDWFWWGAKNWEGHEQGFIAVYRHMFDYLTKQEGMNNLLWVYSAADTYEQSLKRYYPGKQYVDVAGIDVYNDEMETWFTQRDYNDLVSLGHPIGITEHGPTLASAYGYYDYRRVLGNAFIKWPESTFVHVWHDWPGANISIPSNLYMWELMNSPYTLTRGNIALWPY